MIAAAAPTRMDADERDAVRAAVAGVIDGDRWIGGAPVEAFEQQFADYLGHGTVVGVGNGTDALAIALTALDLAPGSAVILAANEGGYAASACRQVGVVPVIADVDRRTMLPGVPELEAAMRTGVAALVMTHLHGESTDLHAVDAWRRQHGLRLVEDCAQAAGADVGATGDAATYSFYPTKNLAAAGDGGAVVFADASLATRARQLREYGWGERFRIEVPGGRNSRLDSVQAAVLSARLPFLDARNERRRAVSARYRATGVPMHGDPVTSVVHHAVVLSERRDELAGFLASRGIQTAVHYPYLLQDMPGLDLTASTPVAEQQRDTKLSLPSYPELTDPEVDEIVAALEEWAHA